MFASKLSSLPKPMFDLISFSGRLGDERGFGVYIVGGFVRDFLLGVVHFDVDLVVEDDAIAFAHELAERFRLRILTHKRFGTATLSGLEGFKVDIASARKEIYERPAALPTVSKGDIRDDLFRRDFTINAMAININRHSHGRLVDYYGGERDLRKGLICVLHAESFIHDPTRIMRAIRFEQRFGFRLDRLARDAMKAALHSQMLHKVQKHRIRDELVLMFKEKKSYACLKRLGQICGYSFIAPGLRLPKEWRSTWRKAEHFASWSKETFPHKRHPELYVMLMALFFYPLTFKTMKKTMLDFAFHKKESSNILSFKANRHRTVRGLMKGALKASGVYRLLEPLTYETILLLLATSKSRRNQKRIEDFLHHHNGLRLHIKGEDLKRLGVVPGPPFKRILRQLLYAKIDGRVVHIEEEFALARRLAKRR